MSTKLALESTTADTATFTVTHSGKDPAGFVVCRSFSAPREPDGDPDLVLVDTEPVSWDDDKDGTVTLRRVEGCVAYDAYAVTDYYETGVANVASNVVEFDGTIVLSKEQQKEADAEAKAAKAAADAAAKQAADDEKAASKAAKDDE